ncbi:sporulation protein YqfD [Caldalkalibacillus thermarum]|uniref:sporulation protein YqfD n=1 Tax=Caldalkalibacillus thermarum TaxID=296745 RepID=UPI001669C08C|nr:sporulation protein YqfD [Caldalkalibacillus thermarum]GGK18592.1 sporulation protein YqfD [Caldalkalibacillus thermarum]
MINNEELVYWWKGYVVITIRGKRLERLINRMMHQRLAAWDLTRESEDKAQVCITVPDLFQLRKSLKETGCRIRIVKKIGLPFILKKMRRQSGLYSGAILFLAMLYLLSSMIWSVEIEGISVPEREAQVRQTLADLGVKPGAFKFRVAEPSEIKRQVTQRLDNVTWVGFGYKGTTAYLEVVEKTLPEEPEPVYPRDLIAKKKAVIHDIFVESGTPMVKPNQYVKPGDLLVSGKIGSEEAPQLTAAKGKVWGEVWYVSEIRVPLKLEKAVLTGERKTRYYLHVGPYKLKVWGYGQIPFDHYVTRDDRYSLSIGSFTLPIAWTIEQVQAARQAEVTLDEAKALNMGLKLAREKMVAKLPEDAEIVEENILKKGIDSGKVYIKIHYSVIEEISMAKYTSQGE